MSTDYEAERDLAAKYISKTNKIPQPDFKDGADWCLTQSSVVKGLVESIEWAAPKIHQAYHEGELPDCKRPVCAEFKIALRSYEAAVVQVKEE